MIPDPLFDDAPREGVDPHGFQWAKGDNVVCATCNEMVEGRRYRVRKDGLWHHAGCVDLYAWVDKPVSTALPHPRTPAKIGTKTWAKAVIKAEKSPNFRLEMFS